MVSCQKDLDLIPENKQTTQKVLPLLDGVELVENRLVFESEDAYNKAKALLRDNNDAEAIMKNQFPNFVNIENAYENITEEERERIGINGDITGYENIIVLERGEDGEVYADLNTGILETKLLVNPDGIIEIGENIKKMEYYNTYTLSKNQYESFLKEGKIKEFLEKESHSVQILGETEVDVASSRANRKCDAQTDGSKRKVKGKVKYTRGVISTKTKHLRKRGWIWWLNRADGLSYSGTASWTSRILGARSWSGGNSCTNCISRSQTIADTFGGDDILNWRNSRFSVRHTAVSSGRTGSCTTRN